MRHSALTQLVSAFTASLAASALGQVGPDRPPALEAFYEARKALRSGEVRWSVLPKGDPDKALSFVSRYARDGDMIYEVRGDKDGWTIHNAQTGEGVSRFPQLHMIRDDAEVWWFQETGLGAKLEPITRLREKIASNQETGLRDIRALGVYPTSGSINYEAGLDWLWGRAGDPFVSFNQRQDGDLFIVTGLTSLGVNVTWYINAARGWNAERIDYNAGELGTWEMVATLTELGNAWFPEEVRFYDNGDLTETIVVEQGSFNLPGDKDSFTLTDLGLEPGTNLTILDGVERKEKNYPIWNGESITTLGEWMEDIRTGKRKHGPTFERIRGQGHYSSPYETPEQVERRRQASRLMQTRWFTERHQRLWERYVRDFLARYQLDAEQTQRAWTIHLECERTATEVMAPRRQEQTALVSEYLAARDAKDPRADELERKLEKLREPIDKTFETQLKPRLDKLPTRTQRRAAEERAAASQPQPTSSPSGG